MKRLLFIILILMLAWNAYAIPPTPPVAAGDGSGDVLAGTMGSTGQYCTKNAATKTIDCNTTPFNAAVPGAIGGTTPAAGTFTKVEVTASTAATTGLSKDGSGNLVISDAVSGSKTLADLIPSNPTNLELSAGEVPYTANGSTLVGKTVASIRAPNEVDGHVDQTQLTADNLNNGQIYNNGQSDADTFLLLPTAAAGMSGLFTVGTARAKHFGVEAGANDKIYLVAADGTVAGGDNAAAVVMTEAQVGQSFACWTFKTDAYDWMCKAISIGTSTFAVHVHSTP